jgi:hypothetical protein
MAARISIEVGIPIENILNMDHYTFKVYMAALNDRGKEIKDASNKAKRR